MGITGSKLCRQAGRSDPHFTKTRDIMYALHVLNQSFLSPLQRQHWKKKSSAYLLSLCQPTRKQWALLLAAWPGEKGFPWLWFWTRAGASLVAQMAKNLPASLPGLGRSPGDGTSYPLQFSCLENSMDTGAWQRSIGSQSQTPLKRLTYRDDPGQRGLPCTHLPPHPTSPCKQKGCHLCHSSRGQEKTARHYCRGLWQTATCPRYGQSKGEFRAVEKIHLLCLRTVQK